MTIDSLETDHIAKKVPSMATNEGSPQLIVPVIGSDRKASAVLEATTTESAALGLALSGGGVRAALFSLGVVIGLIETGCHRRVRCVASVSGGSILNAALAHEKSLASFPSLTEFEPLASKLAASLDQRFRSSNHIRPPCRAYRPKCERRAPD
jgi:hypothetical protein